MINFEPDPITAQTRQMVEQLATSMMRPIAREMDEHEHADPKQYIEFMWTIMKSQAASGAGTVFSTGGGKSKDADKSGDAKPKRPSTGQVLSTHLIEMMSWGDAGVYLSTPAPGLGGAAVAAAGTPDQKERFLKRFTESKEPVWGAMAITEPNAGSDTAAITTTAKLEGDEWVLNGHKIFVTAGKRAIVDSKGFVVVWATVDKTAGRAGIKSFVVEAGTPGMTLLGIEKKHGIRASDTAQIVFENCRIPKENLLGSAEVQKGFKGVMATFDATRPAVAASAIGIGRAALEFTEEQFEKKGIKARYGINPAKLSARERDLMEMEANLKAAWLLTLRASWMSDQKMHNNLEASMSKAKAGLAVTQVTQKAVELMGPLGYSRELLLEKWMRDAKINDIFEGTQQINMLIIARRILGYGREQLK